jgi:hypothetical protein
MHRIALLIRLPLHKRVSLQNPETLFYPVEIQYLAGEQHRSPGDDGCVIDRICACDPFAAQKPKKNIVEAQERQHRHKSCRFCRGIDNGLIRRFPRRQHTLAVLMDESLRISLKEFTPPQSVFREVCLDVGLQSWSLSHVCARKSYSERQIPQLFHNRLDLRMFDILVLSS